MECPFSGITSYSRGWRKDVLSGVTMRQQGWLALDSCRVCSFERHEKFCNLESKGFLGVCKKYAERSALKGTFQSL